METASSVGAIGLAGVLVVGLALLGIALWLWRRTRGGTDLISRVTVAVIAGAGVLCLALFVAGMRHYGGSTGGGPTCGVWWQEVGIPSNTNGLPGDHSDTCRHDAVTAIGGAVVGSVVAGIVAGLLVLAALLAARAMRRRRADR